MAMSISASPDRSRVVLIWIAAVVILGVGGVACSSATYDPLGLRASILSQALVFVAGGVGLALAWTWRARPAACAHVVVAATSCVCAGILLLALAQAPFGLGGLDADQSFRTAMMTRFAISAVPTDFGYAGLGPFMPPLWFWIAGRTADIVGLPGWQMMKWAQIGTAFVVPVVAFVFWRRVVGVLPAAVTTAVAALAIPDPVKGDEWLALIVMVPWWIDALGDVRAPGVRRWPRWIHGLVAGTLLSLYTAFFLPAALATLILLARGIRDGSWKPRLRRMVPIVGVGLVVWSWVWVRAVIERLSGTPYHLIQLRWFGDTSPAPQPFTIDLIGLLVISGAVLLVWYARESSSMRLHGIFVIAIVGVMVAGMIAAAVGQPILVQKTYLLLRYALVAACAIGCFRLVQTLATSRMSAAPNIRAVAALIVVALTTTLGLHYTLDAVRKPSVAAYDTADAGGHASTFARSTPQPRASADQLVKIIGTDAGLVVLSDRYDVFAFHGYWNFNQFTGSYAHPNSQFDKRTAVIEQMGAADTPSRLHALMCSNGYQRIDSLVLSPDKQGRWVYRYRSDNYPDGTTPRTVVFQDSALVDDRLFTTSTPLRTIVVTATGCT